MKQYNIYIRLQRFYAWLVLMLVLPVGLYAKGGAKQTEKQPIDTLSYEQQRRFDYLFLESAQQQQAGRTDVAFDLLQQCLQINPQAAEVYFAQARYLSQMGNDSLALVSLEKAATLQPLNTTYQDRVAQYYLGLGAFDKAIAAYERIYEGNHERTVILNLLVELYSRQKQYDKMLQTIGRIEQVEGISEDLILSKVRVYEMQNDKKSAQKALESLCKVYPNELNYPVMLGNWLMQNGNQKEAYKLYNKVLKEDQNNTSALISLYDYYHVTGNQGKENQLRMRLLTSKNIDSQTKLSLFQYCIEQSEKVGGDSTEILSLFHQALSVTPKDADLAETLASYMYLKKMPRQQVDEAWQRVLSIAPERSSVRLSLLRSYLADKQWDKVIDLCQQGAQYTPDELVYYYYLAWSFLQKDHTKPAIEALKRGVSSITPSTDKELVSEFYAMLGDLYHTEGNISAAYAAYDSCLHWKDNHLGCLNNYAYFLSIEGKELKKAEQMSYKTVLQDPKNGTHLDTYAWILFMQERYTEAKIYIDQALNNDSNSIKSAVIVEHAGDIYALNGLTEKAIKYWKIALTLADNDAKALIERKIKQKKYIAK